VVISGKMWYLRPTPNRNTHKKIKINTQLIDYVQINRQHEQFNAIVYLYAYNLLI